MRGVEEAIEPHGNIGMPAPALGEGAAPNDGSALPEPELSISKDGRAECVDWDEPSPRPSVRCFYTITVKNDGSAPYWGPISVEDKSTGTGPEGTGLNYRLAGWGAIESGGAVFRQTLLGQVIFILMDHSSAKLTVVPRELTG